MCASRTTTKADSLRDVRGVKSAKKIGNNTFEVTYKDGCRAIRLHRTDVVTFRVDHAVVLNTDGWLTTTTKNRINKYSPARVFQKDYVWYVQSAKWRGATVKYFDYIILNQDGSPWVTPTKDHAHNHFKGGLDLC